MGRDIIFKFVYGFEREYVVQDVGYMYGKECEKQMIDKMGLNVVGVKFLLWCFDRFDLFY